MPARKDYPIPDCPKCGSKKTRVLNTYYTNDEEIVRLRECDMCEYRRWTLQFREEYIDPAVYRVIIPNFRDSKQKRVTIRHFSQDIEYRDRLQRQTEHLKQAGADDQQ